MPTAQTDLVLTESRALGPQVRHLVFRRLDAAPVSFQPGQFVNLFFDLDGETHRRSYSLANLTEDTTRCPTLEIAVAHVAGGLASRFFFSAEAGAKVRMAGPYGQLLLPPKLPGRLLLVATGTGVAPYRTMLPVLAHRLRAGALEVALVFGARHREELLYEEDFAAVAARYPAFDYRVCYSRHLPDRPRPYEHAGRVQQQLAALAPDPARDLAFLCGNPAMVDEVFGLLKDQGFPPSQVRREKYLFAPR